MALIPFDQNKPTSWNLNEKDKERLSELSEAFKQIEQEKQQERRQSSQQQRGLSR